jgi:hypothetical protein
MVFGSYSVFERSGFRFARGKRLKTRSESPVLIQSEPKGFGFQINHRRPNDNGGLDMVLWSLLHARAALLRFP